MWLRTGSNSPDINRFQSHTENNNYKLSWTHSHPITFILGLINIKSILTPLCHGILTLSRLLATRARQDRDIQKNLTFNVTYPYLKLAQLYLALYLSHIENEMIKKPRSLRVNEYKITDLF